MIITAGVLVILSCFEMPKYRLHLSVTILTLLAGQVNNNITITITDDLMFMINLLYLSRQMHF